MEDCPLHDHMENCLSIIKNDIKDIEKRDESMAERISAFETAEQHLTLPDIGPWARGGGSG